MEKTGPINDDGISSVSFETEEPKIEPDQPTRLGSLTVERKKDEEDAKYLKERSESAKLNARKDAEKEEARKYAEKIEAFVDEEDYDESGDEEIFGIEESHDENYEDEFYEEERNSDDGGQEGGVFYGEEESYYYDALYPGFSGYYHSGSREEVEEEELSEFFGGFEPETDHNLDSHPVSVVGDDASATSIINSFRYARRKNAFLHKKCLDHCLKSNEFFYSTALPPGNLFN